MNFSASRRREGWFKSSYSNASCSCVEVRYDGDQVLIRDSKYLRNLSHDPGRQPILAVRSADWAQYVGRLAADD
ncbi:MAG: DUF397 domain-containing protein [Acidimicrobiales bacterium]